MNDPELDALLAAPVPELDTTDFSVTLMEAIAREKSRPNRILSWIMVGVLFVAVALAGVFGALAAGAKALADPLAIPSALIVLTLILSYSVLRSARE